MAGLPRKYAKMGFKRGWAVYNKSRKVKRKTTTRQTKMAKHRRKSGFKKKARSFAKGITVGNVTKVLIGAAIAALYEVFVSPMIPLDAMIKNIVELGAGLLLAAMPGIPMPIRAFGAALATINAYTLIVPYVQNFAGSGSSSSQNYEIN